MCITLEITDKACIESWLPHFFLLLHLLIFAKLQVAVVIIPLKTKVTGIVLLHSIIFFVIKHLKKANVGCNSSFSNEKMPTTSLCL